MKVEPTDIPGVLLITPRVFRDARGLFFETWHDGRYAGLGVTGTFVQDNVSVSSRGVLRGLHFQEPNAQGKLIAALKGRVFDVAVDVRRDSATFGQWTGRELSEETGQQMWIPAGFAHGFLVLSDEAVVAYKCTRHYSPADESSICWNDPAIGIHWPITDPVLSEKDAAAPMLRDCPRERLPTCDTVSSD